MGVIQGVLDWLDIPYTHSGMRASALAMDKAASAPFSPVPACRSPAVRVIDIEILADADPLPRPYVVKPAQ